MVTEAAGVDRMPKAGDIVGRYRLLHEIGRGGMAVVFAAEERDGERRQVACKILLPHLRSDAYTKALFAAEGVAVFAAGQAAPDADRERLRAVVAGCTRQTDMAGRATVTGSPRRTWQRRAAAATAAMVAGALHLPASAQGPPSQAVSAASGARSTFNEHAAAKPHTHKAAKSITSRRAARMNAAVVNRPTLGGHRLEDQSTER